MSTEDGTLLPLQGITVVSCEQAVAAPFASRQLADMGARVIKVERPDGGDFARGYDTTVNGMSSHFVWINRSKESLAADLKDPDDLALLERIIASADVFIQNLAPGAAERLGLGAERLRELNPRLIHVSVSGYGSSGPMRTAKAYDNLIQAEVGLISVTGTEEHPAKTGISTADISAGMYALTSILTALYDRERTGEGQTIEVSLFDSLIEWMGYPLYYSRYGGSRPARAGASHAAIVPYGIFAAGDGTEYVIAIQNEREWVRFCETVLSDPDLAVDPRFHPAAQRVAHREDCIGEVAVRLRGISGDELGRRLVEAGVAHARQRDMTEVADHPQLVERGRWETVETPVGPIEMVAPPVAYSGFGHRMDPIPAAGEHSEAIRAEFAAEAGPGERAGSDEPASAGNDAEAPGAGR